jgi:hypothetical protein
MGERVCIFRRIRINLGTARRPAFEYFQEWDEAGFAWWTEEKRKAHRFVELGDARAHLAQVRQISLHAWPEPEKLRLVRVMGQR